MLYLLSCNAYGSPYCGNAQRWPCWLTFPLPPWSFLDRVGEFFKLNVHCWSPRKVGESMGFCQSIVQLFQMATEQMDILCVCASGDHFIHRDTYGLWLRHSRCRIAGILEQKGQRSNNDFQNHFPMKIDSLNVCSTALTHSNMKRRKRRRRMRNNQSRLCTFC